MKFICELCNNAFEKKNTHKYKFCSRECHRKSQLGKPTRRLNKIKRKGYWFVYMPEHPSCGKQGYVAVHRLVMEKHLGRLLLKSEIVHHLNHNITDNRIKNLLLFYGVGEHLKYGHPEIGKKLRVLFKGKHHSPETEWKKRSVA